MVNYGKTDKASGAPRRGYGRAGRYITRVDEFAFTNGHKGETHRVDQTVVKVLEGSYKHPSTGAVITPNRLGEEITDVFQDRNIEFLRQFVQQAYAMSSDEWKAKGGGNAIIPHALQSQDLAGAAMEVLADPLPPKEGQPPRTNPFTPLKYIRRIPAAELKQILDAETAKRFFPDLDETIKEEAAVAAASKG